MSTINFAAETYGWSWQYIVEEIPAINLLLLMRQHVFVNNKGKGISLKTQEEIDSGEIDRLLDEVQQLAI